MYPKHLNLCPICYLFIKFSNNSRNIQLIAVSLFIALFITKYFNFFSKPYFRIIAERIYV